MPSPANPQTRARRAAVSRGVRALHVCVLFVTFMAVCGSAWSSWASLGGGTGDAMTSTLAAPTGVSGTVPAGGTNVSVTWAAASTGAPAAGYVVVRTSTASGDGSPGCGSSSSSPVAATSCTDSSVPDGTYRYSVVAVRGGWTATSLPSAVVTVHLAVATTTTVSATPNPANVGQTVTYTATVVSASGQSTPSGAVTFRDAGSTITCASGSQTLDASGVATCRLAYASPGSHEVTAAYAASGSWAGSTSAPVVQVVTKQSQTVTFTSTAPTNATVGGPTHTVSATATSGLAVTFSSSTPAVCTVSGTTVSYVAAGTCTVSTVQSGNEAYAAAPQVSQSFTVARATQTVTFTSSAPTNATVGGPTHTVSATATSGLAVTFSTSTPAVCTVSGTTVIYVAAGTCTVLADQPGNDVYEAAPQKSLSIDVAAAPTAPANLVVVPAVGTALATWTSLAGYTYECQLTTGSSSPLATGWAACTSPHTFATRNGNQTFWVHGVRGGVVSAPTSRNFSG